MLLELLVAVSALVMTRALWLRWKYDLHRIPSLRGLPFFGHALSIRTFQGEQEISYFIGRYWKKLGCTNVMKVNLVGIDQLCVSDSEFMKSVIMSKTSAFPKIQAPRGRGMYAIIGNDPHAKSLLTTHDVTPYVKAVRKVYSVGFQTSNLRRALPKLQDVMDKMIGIIEKERAKGPIDFQELCVKMTLDSIGVVAFDTNLGGLDDSRELYHWIIEGGHVAVEQTFNPMQALYCYLFPKSKAALKQNAIITELMAQWKGLAQEIVQRDDPPEGEQPMWFALKNLVDPEIDQRLAHNSVVAEVATVVFAGMDTTGHQLAWIFELLATHPRVMDCLIEEFREHSLYGENSREIVFEDLGELKYLTAVIKEAMRIAHIISAMPPRIVPQDMEILGYRVPKGTIIGMFGTRFMNSEAEWKDPDVFRPERWLRDEDLSQKFTLAFSQGPRDCAGQRLAMMEMRLAILQLVRTYVFSPTVPIAELMKRGRTGMTIEAIDGIWLNATPRKVMTVE